jgi:hypothetical protein
VHAFKRTEKILLCGILLYFLYAQAGQAFSASPRASGCLKISFGFLYVQNAKPHRDVGNKPLAYDNLTLYAHVEQTVKLQHWLQSSHSSFLLPW